MNERIKELAKRAQQYADQQWLEAGYPSWETYSEVFAEDFNSKFAELIVRECVNAIQTEKDTGLYNAQQMTGMTVSLAVIKDHFGVDE